MPKQKCWTSKLGLSPTNVSLSHNSEGVIQGEREEQSELEKLRLEMVEELRKVREDLRQANAANHDLIAELKQMNLGTI